MYFNLGLWLKETGLSLGSRATCIAVRKSKYHWWAELQRRYIRRYKLTITICEFNELADRIIARADRFGHRVLPKHMHNSSHRRLTELSHVLGNVFCWWNLGDYKRPDGNFCDVDSSKACSFCGGKYDPGKQFENRFGEYFCSDRCKRGHALLRFEFTSRSNTQQKDVYVPLIVLINRIAAGIQNQHPVAMKILHRRSRD